MPTQYLPEPKSSLTADDPSETIKPEFAKINLLNRLLETKNRKDYLAIFQELNTLLTIIQDQAIEIEKNFKFIVSKDNTCLLLNDIENIHKITFKNTLLNDYFFKVIKLLMYLGYNDWKSIR